MDTTKFNYLIVLKHEEILKDIPVKYDGKF